MNVPLDGRQGCARWWVLGIVSCAGAGYVPWAPGTAGALVGTAVAVLTEASLIWQWGLVLVTLALSVWLIPSAQRLLGRRDPQEIVIDECCGALVTLIGLPLTPAVIVTGFVAFRLLDIWKPGPLRRLEQLPGAWGVLADDLAAGLVAHLAAWWVALR